MRIRTQDKRNSVDMNGLTIRACTEDTNRKGHYDLIAFSVNSMSSDDFILLGDYSSNEKALKVLDMIEEVYTECNEWLYVNGKVFVMPADEEVNV